MMVRFERAMHALADAASRLVPERWRGRFHRRRWRWWSGGRRSVARGVALGLFCGLLIPFGQIPASLILAPLMRANIAAAAASTFVTNPLTMPFVYAAGYWLGTRLMRLQASLFGTGIDAAVAVPATGGVPGVVTVTAVGVVVLSLLAALTGYALVWWLWPRHVSRRRRPRMRFPRPPADQPPAG
jgi:uncharacterized protein